MRSWLPGIVALALGVGWIFSQDVALSVTQPSSDSVVAVAEPLTVQQSVASHHPGLTAVMLRLEPPFPPADQPVTLIVREDVTLALVVSMTVPFEETAGPCINPCGPEMRGMRFTLPKQDDSEGRAYVFEVLTVGHPLHLAVATIDMYSEGQLLKPTLTGDLVFGLDYNSQLGAMTPSLARQIAAGRPGISGSIVWVPGIVLVYGLVVVLVLRQARALFTGW